MGGGGISLKNREGREIKLATASSQIEKVTRRPSCRKRRRGGSRFWTSTTVWGGFLTTKGRKAALIKEV